MPPPHITQPSRPYSICSNVFLYLRRYLISDKLVFEKMSISFCVQTKLLLPKWPYRPWDHFMVFVKKWVWPSNYQSDCQILGYTQLLFFLYSWWVSLCVEPRHNVPGSRTRCPGSRIHYARCRIQDPGSWIQDPGSWIQDPGELLCCITPLGCYPPYANSECLDKCCGGFCP